MRVKLATVDVSCGRRRPRYDVLHSLGVGRGYTQQSSSQDHLSQTHFTVAEIVVNNFVPRVGAGDVPISALSFTLRRNMHREVSGPSRL